MMLAASTVDTTVIAAFAVGFASFISPCVLPLVPGYLSAVSGVTVAELQQGDHKTRHVLWPAAIFCLSFTIIFVALGMSATGLGSLLADNRRALEQISGIVIILLGLYFVATPFVDKLNREWRPDALMMRATGGPIIAGAAFAIAWTPCVGPTLGSILTAASASDTVGQGGVLLAFYSLGLAIPFLLFALAFDRATTAFRWLRQHYLVITAVSGAVLIAMGVLLLTGQMTALNDEAESVMRTLGLDFVYDL
jgi:cytochrome c-type biogenesis protein